jgi:outer membrane protein TolC
MATGITHYLFRGDSVMIKRVTAVITRALILATCALGCGGPVLGESLPKPPIAEKAPQTVSDVIQAYQDIIVIRRGMLAETEHSHRSGRSDSTKLSRDRIELSEACLQFAAAQGRQNEVRTELETILSVRQEILDTLKHRQASGHAAQYSLNEARIAVLEAKIRLARMS